MVLAMPKDSNSIDIGGGQQLFGQTFIFKKCPKK